MARHKRRVGLQRGSMLHNDACGSASGPVVAASDASPVMGRGRVTSPCHARVRLRHSTSSGQLGHNTATRRRDLDSGVVDHVYDLAEGRARRQPAPRARDHAPTWRGRLRASHASKAWVVLVASAALVLALSMPPGADARAEPTHTLSEAQFFVLRDATLACASLSVIGTAFIVVSYVVFPDLQTFPFKLIVYLSLSNFFSSVAFYFDLQGDYRIDDQPGFQCYFGAGLAQFFDVASFLWTAVIGFNIWQVLVKKRGRGVEAFEKYYHLLCWGVPLVTLIIAAAGGALGDAGNWCWIKEGYDGYRFTLYFTPLLLVLLFNTALYTAVIRGVRESTLADTVIFRLRLYLLVFVGLRFFSAINRIQHTAQPSDPIFVLYLLHSIASPLQGFANAMVYGFTAKVRQQYKRALCPRRETDVENPLRMLSSSQREFTGSSQLKPPSVDSQSTINGVHNARTKSSRTTSTGSHN